MYAGHGGQQLAAGDPVGAGAGHRQLPLPGAGHTGHVYTYTYILYSPNSLLSIKLKSHNYKSLTNTGGVSRH